MKVEFSLVKRERPVYVFDLRARAGILIGDRLTENAVNNHCDSTRRAMATAYSASSAPSLVLEKAFDVLHRLFLRLV